MYVHSAEPCSTNSAGNSTIVAACSPSALTSPLSAIRAPRPAWLPPSPGGAGGAGPNLRGHRPCERRRARARERRGRQTATAPLRGFFAPPASCSRRCTRATNTSAWCVRWPRMPRPRGRCGLSIGSGARPSRVPERGLIQLALFSESDRAQDCQDAGQISRDVRFSDPKETPNTPEL
jgi:hypothetical protein